MLEPGMFFSDASPYKDDFALPTNLIEKIFPIFHYHTFYKAWSFSDDDESVRITRLMKGFQTTEDTTPYTGGSDYMEENEKPEEIQDLNRRYLNDIVSFCNENGIKIIVAALPSPVNYNMGKHKAVSEWADEYGIEFIDLNLMQEELGIDWNTDTKDGGDHLNIEGSKKVTGFLAEHEEIVLHGVPEPGLQQRAQLRFYSSMIPISFHDPQRAVASLRAVASSTSYSSSSSAARVSGVKSFPCTALKR